MSAVLYEIEVGEKVMIARSKKDAFRIAKGICEMEHKRAVVIATTLKTGREMRTVFE